MKKGSQMQLIKKNKQEGASMIEYAVIAAIIIVAAVAGLQLIGTNLSNAFNTIAGYL